MNREIKYRGLTSNGNWVCGNLIQGKNGACYICSINENPVYKNGDYWYIDSPCYVVIPETVGQFTGYKDKNANEIFEGDIIGDWTDVDGKMEQSKLTVYFDEMLGQWMLDNSSKQDKTISYSLFSELQDFEYEIIGNIYENPDLLPT